MAEKKEESWINAKWRPVMGWLYMATCAFDFIVAPIAWAILQALLKLPVKQWEPLTLQGAGLYHLAMGAVLGVAAWSRGQEKMAGVGGSSPGFGSSPMGASRPLTPSARPMTPARDTDEEDADNSPRRR